MRGRQGSLALALLAGALGASVASPDERWVEVRSPSFTLVSDGREADARQVLLQFEQMRALLVQAWPGARVDTVRPVTILAVRDEAALRTLLPSYWEKKGAFHPAGTFLEGADRSWVVLRTDAVRADRPFEDPYSLVFHEYVHLVLRLNFAWLPTWLHEGLAVFWGNTLIVSDLVYEGLPLPSYLSTLKWKVPLSLPALFAVDYRSREIKEEKRAEVCYAESWALVHYLALGPAERRGQVNRFAGLLQAGRPAGDAAREAFGDLEKLEKELQSYVRSPAMSYRRRTARVEVDEKAWTVRSLPEAESLAHRAGFHVAMGRAVEARALAGQSLALDRGTAAAHEALAFLVWREGRTDAAREGLAMATSLPGASDYAHYLYGRLLWESLTRAEDLERVEASFRRAIELNPSFAAAYQSLARVRAQRGAPLAEVRPLAARAAQLEPGAIEHSLAALRLAARGGAVEEARARAEELLARAEGNDKVMVDALLRELSDPRKSAGGLYFDPQGADFSLWIEAFNREVYRNLVVPKGVTSEFRGHVDLEFTVERDGSVSAVRVLKPSGNRACDKAAEETLAASRFAVLPFDYDPPRATIQATFFYNETPTPAAK